MVSLTLHLSCIQKLDAPLLVLFRLQEWAVILHRLTHSLRTQHGAGSSGNAGYFFLPQRHHLCGLQGSPLAHMGIILSTLSTACGIQSSSQQFGQALLSQPSLLRPLHTMITVCLETPTAAEAASSVDIALYEALADALAPSSQQEDQAQAAGPTAVRPSGMGSNTIAQSVHQQMAQLVLGTFIPRYLERWISHFCTPSHCHANIVHAKFR